MEKLTIFLSLLFMLFQSALGQTVPNIQTYTPTASLVVIGIAAILSGLLFTFFGIKLFKPVLFIAGFYIGVLVAFIVLAYVEPISPEGISSWASNRDLIYFIVAIVVGLVFGALSICMWRFGLSLVGAFGGFCLAMFILSWVQGGAISDGLARSIFIAVFCIIGGVAALFMEDHVVILSTSICGSFGLVYGVDCFVGSGFKDAVPSFLGSPTKYTVVSDTVLALLISWLVIAVMGALVQYRITGRGQHVRDNFKR